MTEQIAIRTEIPQYYIIIGIGVLIILLTIAFILGRKYQKFKEPGVYQKARWFMNLYEKAEREKGELLAKLNIIRECFREVE